MSLCRFALCRNIINIDKSRPTKITGKDLLKNVAKTGKLIAARIEAKEMILLVIKVTSHTKTVNINMNFKPAIFTERPSNTPKVVATPFPPLNPKNIVQLCPQIQLTPTSKQKISSGITILPVSILPNNTTGRNPLNMSRINTVIPQPFPRSLRALVAPTFPEPNLRISVPLIIRPKI